MTKRDPIDQIVVFPVARWPGNCPAAVAAVSLALGDRQQAVGLLADLAKAQEHNLIGRGVPKAIARAAVGRFVGAVRDEIAAARNRPVAIDG